MSSSLPPVAAAAPTRYREIIMNKRVALLCMTAAIAAAGITAPAQADPPPWAPAHGRHAKEAREYSYVYYPAQRAYYAPETHTWFWLNGANWQFGIDLPSQLQIGLDVGGVPVVLHSNRPYAEHVYVEEQYGRPWREAHAEEITVITQERRRHGKHGHGDD
jgi:hypothetical protein